MATALTTNSSLVFNAGEGAHGPDFQEMATAVGTLEPNLAETGMNLDPQLFQYNYTDNSFIWSNGVQPLARPGTGASTVTNNAGTIYVTSGSATYAVRLPANAFALGASDFTADATHPRYATVGLTVSVSTTNESRRMLDDATRAITTASVLKHHTVTLTPTVTLGTPATFPTIPSFTGTPWAIVYIPANNLVAFTDVRPCAFPRGFSRHQVSAFAGYSYLGGPRNAQIAAWGYVSNGAIVDSWNVSSIAPNSSDFVDITLSVPLQSTSSYLVLASSIDTNIGYQVQARVRSSVGGAGTNGLITFQGTLYAGGNAQLQAGGNNKFVFQVVDTVNGFFSSTYDDTGVSSITCAGAPADGWEWAIPFPVTAPDKRIAKIIVHASAMSSRFEIATLSGIPAIIVGTTDMNSVLTGSTFDLTQLNYPVWCTGGQTPFATNNNQLVLLWTPSLAGETLTGVEFIFAG